MTGEFRFSFGPWNIHEGADPFGPAVRESIPFNRKLAEYKQAGLRRGAVPRRRRRARHERPVAGADRAQGAGAAKRRLDEHGLVAEFVAPRLWEDPRTIDGGYTSNDPKCREYARERSRRCIDIANALGTDLIVLWLAREGTYIREAKDSVAATERLVEAVNDMLAYDPNIRIAIEPKPNEPMDHAYIPTTGHAIALAGR